MQYVDFHQFSFTVFEELTEEQISNMAETIFGFPFSSFERVDRYRNAYRYFYSLGNMVFIYCGPAGNNAGTTYIEIKGNGCDTLNINWTELIKWCLTNNCRIRNVHLYIDDTENILPIDRLCNEFKPNHVNRIISKAKSVPLLLDSDSRTLQFGHKSSGIQITIYEKGLYEGVEFPWNRVEIKLSNHESIHHHLTDYMNGAELGTIAKGLLSDRLDFKVDGTGPKKRRETESFWSAFLGNVEKRKLGIIPPPPRSITKRLHNLTAHVKKELRALGEPAYMALSSILQKHAINTF